MFKVSDRLSIKRDNGVTYNYTIDTFEFGTLNLLHVTAMMEIEVAEGLILIESMKGYVSSYNGFIYFRSKEEAEELLKFLNEFKKTLN